MGSINRSHNEADGGVLLFNGELILLYCDSVGCEMGGKESFKGRVYLTTHRLVVTVAPYRQNAPIKSFCAPFCAIIKCSVEQPVFGSNYIEATVRDEADPSKSFSFKLKFSKGGAIELAMAMNRAVQAVGRNYNPSSQLPPAYTPSPSAQYYQAPPTVYAPGYNSGIQQPVQQFPDQPPIGFIYASEAPPPYPGLGGNTGSAQGGQQQPSVYNPQQPFQGGGGYTGGYPGGYPGYQQQPTQTGYSAQQPPTTGVYPGQQPPATGGYSGQQPPAPGGYPGQQPPAPGGYSGQQPPAPGGYSGQQTSGYPQQPSQGQPSSAGYPDLSQATSGAGGYPGSNQQPQQQPQTGGAWPTAPSYNPNWQQEDKKNN